MPIALKNETYGYILEAEREDKNAPVFHIGTIPGVEFAELNAMSSRWTNRGALDRINVAIGIIGKDKAEKMSPSERAAAIASIDPKCDEDDLIDWSKYRIAVLKGLQAGLRGWSEFKHADGSTCPFQVQLIEGRDRPTLDTLACIDRDSMQEIYNEIMRVNRLSAEDRVNLALAS